MAEIRLQQLAHSYSANPSGPEDYAIREMTHIWEQGGAYALLGPSGCGKTTIGTRNKYGLSNRSFHVSLRNGKKNNSQWKP